VAGMQQNYDATPKVERKVTAATVAAYVGLAAVAYVIELVAAEPIIVSPLPDVLEPLVLALVPALAALVAGYRARHTPRPDLPPAQR
jgi:hypothetical protein